MGLMSIFKGKKKETDCCKIEIIPVEEDNKVCCDGKDITNKQDN